MWFHLIICKYDSDLNVVSSGIFLKDFSKNQAWVFVKEI